MIHIVLHIDPIIVYYIPLLLFRVIIFSNSNHFTVKYFLNFTILAAKSFHSPLSFSSKPIDLQSPIICWVKFLNASYNFGSYSFQSQLIFNRPGVARVVLQSPPSLIHLANISSKYSQYQTRRARELKFGENVPPTLCVMRHKSCIVCHMSHIMCHLPNVF